MTKLYKTPTMKTILLGLLLFTGIVKAQIVNIPDANFKAKLISSNFDNNGDGEIQVSEVQSATYLDVSQSNISDMTGIEEFINITYLTCFGNQITTLNLSNLTNLQTLYCNYNQLTTLNISGLTNIQTLNCNSNNLTSLDVSNMTNLNYLSCNTNQISSLNVSGLTSLTYLDCFLNQISLIDVISSVNLTDLNCSYNQITSLNISSLNNLVNLNCAGNQLTSLNINTLTTLQKLICNNNYLTSFDTTNLTNLKELDCSYNQLSAITISGLVNLEILRCGFNSISTLNLSGINNLKHLDIEHCQITTINLTNLTNLEIFNAYNNPITSLDLNNLINLKSLSCSGNQLTSLNINSLINLESLVCSFSSITSLNTSNSPNLKALICVQNQLTSLNLSNNNNLEYLDCSINQLTSLDVTNLTLLKTLRYGNNYLPNVDFSGLTQLDHLALDATGRTSLDVSNQPVLRILYCNSNLFPVIDVSMSSQLRELVCGGQNLSQILMKNGSIETYFNIIVPSPNLQFVCGDEGDLTQIQTAIAGSGSPAVATSYCTFVPGGTYNTITGKSRFDITNNGCDANDPNAINLRIKINDGSNNESSLVNLTGDYIFYTGAGNFTIIPELEIPTYFNVSPSTAIVNFPTVTNLNQLQDFCLVANGVHPDVEIVIAPDGVARPGFDSNYKIVFKNKGNQTLSGTVNLQFDDAKIDFVSALPAVNSQILNSLIWNYSNLKPFESRSILLTLNINSPVEIPAVNNGDILNFSATVIPIAGDELPIDNSFNFIQIVVGSYDPNDITCLEGETVAPSEIGNYLHYVARFENLGTFYAENVVVRMEIDPTKYDIATLQLLNTSHPSYTRIKGNIVEFIFEDINLAEAAGNPPVGGHGDVLFKIKTKDNLVTNDTVLQRAGIYFDYNFPVITNDAETTFAALNNPNFELDNSVKVYPNPSKGNVNINCNFNIKSIELYDVQGRILETNLVNDVSKTIDISTKQNGIYFIKITTDKGIKVEKLIKE